MPLPVLSPAASCPAAASPRRIIGRGWLELAALCVVVALALALRLPELSYVEAQNIGIEWRFADGREERLPQLAAELIGLPVDLILAAGPAATLAAKDASTTLPIVMCFGGDPIRLGLIASLARPGGNGAGRALTLRKGYSLASSYAATRAPRV